MTTSVTLSVSETIIFPGILGKDSTLARTETSTRYSASPHRGDGVDPGYFRRVLGVTESKRTSVAVEQGLNYVLLIIYDEYYITERVDLGKVYTETFATSCGAGPEWKEIILS